jgi:hypothetical protein
MITKSSNRKFVFSSTSTYRFVVFDRSIFDIILIDLAPSGFSDMSTFFNRSSGTLDRIRSVPASLRRLLGRMSFSRDLHFFNPCANAPAYLFPTLCPFKSIRSSRLYRIPIGSGRMFCFYRDFSTHTYGECDSFFQLSF